MDSNFFSVLTEADKDFLDKNKKIHKYSKGETIFSPCDRCQNLSYIIKGQVKLSKFNFQGKEQIISFLEENDVFGEALVFNEIEYPVHVIAEKDCVIGMLDKSAILELTSRNKEFTRVFFEELTRKILLLNNKVELLSFSSIKQRLAFFLLRISREAGSENIHLPFSKQKVASLLGTSREVISRNFSDMEAEGHINPKGKMIKLNVDSLISLIED